MSAWTRIVEVHPGEGERVALTVGVAAVAAAGLMIGGSAIEAIFFAERGAADRLPVLYLILGVTMFVATLGYAALVGRMGRGRAALAIPVVLGVLAVAGRIALLEGGSTIASALWLVQAVAQFLVGLTVWGLAGLVTDTRQAKRFFPLIGAGSVLGYVVGGLATRPLASLLGSANLLFVWVASLAIVVALGMRIVALGDAGTPRRSSTRSRAIADLRAGLRYVARSPVMRWMALGALLFSFLFFSLYLPFSSAAAQRFPDPDELAGFFGLFFGLSTGLAFVLSLVVTNRLLARFGVPTVLIVLPVLYLVGFGVLTLRDTFIALAVTRFAQVAWLQGGAVSAVEAVTNTAPADRRDQARAFLYGGPTQLGTIVAGALAIAGRSWSPTAGFAIATACALAATVAMVAVRRRYPRELVRALREGRPSVFERSPDAGDPFGLARDDRSAVDAARAALADDDPRLRRIGAQIVGDLAAPDAAGGLLVALSDDDADVRAIAIGSLGRIGSPSDVRAIARCLEDADPRVRGAAVEAIGALSPEPGALLARATSDPDPLVRARAAGVAARHGRGAEVAALLLGLATHDRAEVRESAYEGLTGAGGGPATDVELRGLSDPDPRVRAAAARALVVSPEVGDRLLAALADPATREGALVALETHRPQGVQVQMRGAAIAMAEHAVVRRAQAAAFAGTPDPRERLLADSLDAVVDREARAAVRTAAALDGGADVAVALDNLADGRARADAIEVLETVGDPRIVRPLLAVWEGVPAGDAEASAVLATLASDDDAWIRSCARFAAQATSGRAAEDATMGEIATTLSPMERVLFLRQVPLFATSPPADLLPVATIVEERSFAAGEMLAARGDMGDEMHIVVSGSVAVSIGADDGGTIATRGPGDAIGEMTLLTGRPRVADLTAIDDVRTLAIARPQFEAILRERPQMALTVIRVLCDRLEEGAGADGRSP